MNENVNTNAAALFQTRQLTLVALMTAVICILGPISIPIGPVPISLTVFAVYLSTMLLGMKHGTLACLLYLLIGLCGLPVFSGYAGGPAKLFGPTGGYLVSFVFMALISGYFIDRFGGKIVPAILGMLLGLLICYLFGTTWLSVQAHMGFPQALAAGVLPFIPVDLLKIALALSIGSLLRKRLPFLQGFATLYNR